MAGYVPNAFRAVLLEALAGRTNVLGGVREPVLNAATTATTGGTLAAATYFYKITAINSLGETGGSNEVSIVTTGATSTVGLSWAAVAGATGYKVYRATATGGQSTSPALVTTLGLVTSYTDTGTAVSAGAVPSSNSTGTAMYLGLATALPDAPLTATLANITEEATPGYARILVPSFSAASVVSPVQITTPTQFQFAAFTADAATPANYAFLTTALSGTVPPIRYIFELAESVRGKNGIPIVVPASSLIIE